MKLDNLKPLHIDMRKNNMSSCHFPYTNGRGNFDVLFFIDSKPFVLGFGVKGGQIYFEIDVEPGYRINTYLPPDILEKLKRALEIDNATGRHPFSTNNFFDDFNKHVPQVVKPIHKLSPEHIAKYRSDVEEPDKCYFVGWRDNKKRGETVTENNLDKTRRLLGEEAFKKAKRGNFSSCWSADSIYSKKATIL